MMLVDNSEPGTIVKLLKQSCPVTVSPLNQMKMSDYFFGNFEGKRFQFSRKQAAELLGNIDEAEDQLRDYYMQADENFQIVEGIISPMPLLSLRPSELYAIKFGPYKYKSPHITRPNRGRDYAEMVHRQKENANWTCCICKYFAETPVEHINILVHHKDGNPYNDEEENRIVICSSCHDGITYGKVKVPGDSGIVSTRSETITPGFVGTVAYKVNPDGYLYDGRDFGTTTGILYAWIHRLAEAGITTYWTMNWVETAKLLAVVYRNEQKPPEEHQTLKRIIKPRIQVQEADPFVKALMSLSWAYKLDIGEKRAKALADRYCCLLDLALSDVKEITEVEGVGEMTARKLLKALKGDET